MKITTIVKIIWFSVGAVCLEEMWRCIHAL
jgi:hypothetical protein